MLSLVVSFLPSVLGLLTAFYAVWQMKHAQASISEKVVEVAEGFVPSLDDYIFQDEKGEWQMDARLVKLTDALGSRLALSMRQSFFQAQGVSAKLEKGLMSAAVEDILEAKAGPLALIDDLFAGGRVKAYLKKNPGSLQSLLPLISNFMGKNHPGSTSSGGGRCT